MMAALLWKDFRVNRTIILGNIIFVPVIYLIVIIALANGHHMVTIYEASQTIGVSAIVCICLTCLLAAAYGGHAFAQERQERSANFLAMLPVSRRFIILSKIIASSSALLAMVLINALVLLFACMVMTRMREMQMNRNDWTDLTQSIIFGGSITLMLFGVGWLLSTYIQSASLASLMSIGISLAINMLIVLIFDRMDLPRVDHNEMQFWFCTSVSFLIGACSFVAGTIYYLRRVEP